MKWTITIKPLTVALNAWTWTAVREDQENVLVGDQAYATSEAATATAQADIQNFEDNVMVLRNATLTMEFIPEGVEIDPEPETPEP